MTLDELRAKAATDIWPTEPMVTLADAEAVLAECEQGREALRSSVLELSVQYINYIEAIERKCTAIIKLTKDAVNIAGGLTNYVESRPELRSAERELEAIRRALIAMERSEQL